MPFSSSKVIAFKMGVRAEQRPRAHFHVAAFDIRLGSDRATEDCAMSINRSKWPGALACAAPLTAACPPASAQQQQKPNILFIMDDDIGWIQPHIYHRGLMVGDTKRTFRD
jgi:hypothetical protein